MGRFFFHIMGALAEMERELIVERTRAGLEAARAQAGRLIGAGIPRQRVAIIYDVGLSTLYRNGGIMPPYHLTSRPTIASSLVFYPGIEHGYIYRELSACLCGRAGALSPQKAIHVRVGLY